MKNFEQFKDNKYSNMSKDELFAELDKIVNNPRYLKNKDFVIPVNKIQSILNLPSKGLYMDLLNWYLKSPKSKGYQKEEMTIGEIIDVCGLGQQDTGFAWTLYNYAEKNMKNFEQFINENLEVEGVMRLVHTGYGYEFYMGEDDNGKTFYNIVPIGSNEPNSGYYDSDYICKIKGVKNVFKTIEKEHTEIKNAILDQLKKDGY